MAPSKKKKKSRPSKGAGTGMRLADFTKVDLNTASPQNASDFMKYPQEVRDRIYEFVFEEPVVIDITSYRFSGQWMKNGLPKAPGLLLTCKSVYHQAIKLYWSTSTFRFPRASSITFLPWLLKLRRRRRELLSNVELEVDWTVAHVSRFGYMLHPNHPLYLEQALAHCHRLLQECEAGRRGVPENAMKVNLVVPVGTPPFQGLDLRVNERTEIWTSKPIETATPYLTPYEYEEDSDWRKAERCNVPSRKQLLEGDGDNARRLHVMMAALQKSLGYVSHHQSTSSQKEVE